MVYLDANVFVFAALAADELGDAARQILRKLRGISAKTCCLTMDELAWAVLRREDNAMAVRACRAVLELKDLDIVSVEYGDVWEMARVMENYDLRPRDALHYAVMRRLNEETIITEDIHFKKIGVKRMSIKDFEVLLNQHSSAIPNKII